MDSAEFRVAGHAMVDYIANYLDTVEQRPVLSTVEPNYLRPMLPAAAPEEGESFEKILEDVERIIMPGVTHWRSPYFLAYYPGGGSYPSYLADMLSGAIGCLGFSWITSPACTELEMVMMDWLAKACGLPEQFLFVDEKGNSQQGGGIIQGTASEATLVTLLAARKQALAKIEATANHDSALGKLVAYTSEQAHQSVVKGGAIAAVTVRSIACTANDGFAMTADNLQKAIEADKALGLVPFWVCATVGTTSSCAVDDLPGIGALCEKEGLWLHVDAAYAGAATVCPEHRTLLKGVELATSYSFNPHKWLLVNFDCSALWVKDKAALTSTFHIDAAYLQNKATSSGLVVDYKDWQIPFGRRFRSLKLWFVMRMYGVAGMRNHIRKHCQLAKQFLELVQSDNRFEISAPPCLGLVVFRLKGSNDSNKILYEAILADGKMFISPTILGDQYALRWVVCSTSMTEQHVVETWDVIKRVAHALGH